MNMLNALEKFLSTNPTIHCHRLFPEFDSLIRTNEKLIEYPTLKPRLFAAFNKIQ